METVQDIIGCLDKLAPQEMAQEWDNVGLMTGDRNAQVTKILTALDVDEWVVSEAVKCGADMIVTHHPLIFSPLKTVTSDTYEGRCILAAARYGIAIFSAHTNLDAAEGGTNDYLARLYELERVGPLPIAGEENLGRVGEIPPQRLGDLAKTVAVKLGISSVEVIGNVDRIVRRVAICSGGGGSFVTPQLLDVCDVYITGDIKYSNARDAHNIGLNVIVAPHYETEKYAMRILADWCKKQLPDVEVVCSQANRNVIGRV